MHPVTFQPQHYHNLTSNDTSVYIVLCSLPPTKGGGGRGEEPHEGRDPAWYTALLPTSGVMPDVWQAFNKGSFNQ